MLRNQGRPPVLSDRYLTEMTKGCNTRQDGHPSKSDSYPFVKEGTDVSEYYTANASGVKWS